MIVFRYLFKEVLLSTLAVTAVLLMVIMSGRFIQYLGKAASGEMSPDIIFVLIGYRVPGFLELILPLGLFLGVLLAYGRLYLEHEMTVLTACGFSPNRLQLCTLGPVLLITLLVGFLSLWATPWSTGKFEVLSDQQKTRTGFESLLPGRFQLSSTGNRVTYAESIDDGNASLHNVFISERGKGRKPQLGVVAAEKGTQYIDPVTGEKFLLLENGYRYDGIPGEANYRRIKFDQYGVKIDEPNTLTTVKQVETIPTLELLGSSNPEYKANLHWRLSLPILCIVVGLLAVPLSKVNPRQGRYALLLPSIILYLTYISILSNVRSGLETGDLQSVFILWIVHLLFLAFALILHFFRDLVFGWFSRLAGFSLKVLPWIKS